MIKKIILDRINKIKGEENNFKSQEWENIFCSYGQWFRDGYELPIPGGKNTSFPTNSHRDFTKHISEVPFDEIDDESLVRLFEFIILLRDDISARRVNKTYFYEKEN